MQRGQLLPISCIRDDCRFRQFRCLRTFTRAARTRIVCFTSITFSYLGRARVLAGTVKRFHPDWRIIVCISDLPPEEFDFDPSDEPFDHVVWAHELPIPNVSSWLFRHDIVELCTAVKGPLSLEILLDRAVDKVIYLDPDIAVFAPLDSVVDELDHSSIALTPHQLDPDEGEMAIFDNEVSSLQHGVYNLGFLAIRNDALGDASPRGLRSDFGRTATARSNADSSWTRSGAIWCRLSSTTCRYSAIRGITWRVGTSLNAAWSLTKPERSS